jgi:hypothetical protein
MLLAIAYPRILCVPSSACDSACSCLPVTPGVRVTQTETLHVEFLRSLAYDTVCSTGVMICVFQDHCFHQKLISTTLLYDIARPDGNQCRWLVRRCELTSGIRYNPCILKVANASWHVQVPASLATPTASQPIGPTPGPTGPRPAHQRPTPGEGPFTRRKDSIADCRHSNNEDMDLEYIGPDDMDCSCIGLDDDMDFKCIGLDDDTDGPEETRPQRIASMLDLSELEDIDDMDFKCIGLGDDRDFKYIGLDDDMDFKCIGLDDDMAGPEETKPERIASVRNLRDQADNGHMDFRCIGLGEELDFRCIGLGEELEFDYIDQEGEINFRYIGFDDDMDFKCVGLENDPACPSDRGWQRQVSGGTLA